MSDTETLTAVDTIIETHGVAAADLGYDRDLSKNFDAVGRAAQISFQIRNALSKAFPSPPEQYLTVMVPGKVVNIDAYTGGFNEEGKPSGPVLPFVTELNQAALCDEMPVLAPIQLAPAGKSVAHSYDAAISKLLPAGSLVGIDVVDVDELTEDEKRCLKGMQWLAYRDPAKGSMTRIEIYTEKQNVYTERVQEKAKAFSDALTCIRNDPRYPTLDEQRAAYDKWVSENARMFRNYVQAAYMDWVISGLKEEAEYWFAIVDRDTAMARVEASKEAMRTDVVRDTDGVAAYNRVKLAPSNWAILAKNKTRSAQGSEVRTPEWYTWEISRLKSVNGMLEALLRVQPPHLVNHDPDPFNSPSDELITSMAMFLNARNDYQVKVTDKGASEEEKQKAYASFVWARTMMEHAEARSKHDSMEHLNALNNRIQDQLYALFRRDGGRAQELIHDNKTKIDLFDAERQALIEKKGERTLLAGLSIDIGRPPSKTDIFTAITVEIPSFDGADIAFSYEPYTASFGGSTSWGLQTLGDKAGSSDVLLSQAANQMARNRCKVSFESIRVDIMRSWLRPELFFDTELKCASGEFISPGFSRLRQLMEMSVPGLSKDEMEQELQRYSTFPMYPAGFLLATNIVLEITGEVSDIAAYFESVSSPTGVNAGYGPFQLSSASFHATTDGCRIVINSPQIVAWISQIVPALPRITDPPRP